MSNGDDKVQVQLSLDLGQLESQLEFVKGYISLWKLEHDLCPGCPGPDPDVAKNIQKVVSQANVSLTRAVELVVEAKPTATMGPLAR